MTPYKFILYGTSACHNCDKAKQLLTNSKLNFVYRDIQETYPEDWRVCLLDLQLVIGEKHKTIPLVFCCDESIPEPELKNIGSFQGWQFIGSYVHLEDFLDNIDVGTDY
jgi:hypothetical protein